ncbi:hypothetical protein P153DRAFT_392530 [Dothidotthia symphoricarpi CBS 119687]|uniref:Uncharacterized protein n=1 Tax=Dothidotthia symphoricarpi CBS 119687 TaxID=1392245 RepID=A0A6A6ASE1_9PLEO|nr:uncharacterized protein P153DRAFT_392530 [Dothidotthia symphoricarpi CBS 119687]KAF2133905.1 hypothetical protein P153DRAFT_392530 [Dothidotthia symphoricarpi CBS 119687]
MLVMGSDWPHRALPRFSELFSSSSAAAIDTIPSYERIGDSESILRNTPSTAPAPSAPAIAERPLWMIENHASTQPNLPELSVPAMAPGRQFQRYSAPQAAMPRGSASTSEVCLMQDAAHTQTPISAPRQDSAVLPSPDFTFSSSIRSPRSAHRQPSPRPHSHSSTHSSPTLTAVILQSHQTNSHSGPHHSQRNHSTSLSSTSQNPLPFPRTHEYPGDQTAVVDIRPAAKTMRPSSPHDHINGNNNNNTTAPVAPPARQGRYNVRFAANYTSENMPSSQKHRQDAAPATPASAPTAASEPSPTSQEQPAPTEEPSIKLFNATLQSTDSQQSQSRQKEGESSVERCHGCNEAWRRPLPNIEQFRRASPAETGHELSMTSHNLIAQLRDHRLKADAAYDQWKWHHSHCIPREGYIPPTSPSSIASPDDIHSKDTEFVSHNGNHTETLSNKRKSDIPHEEDQPTTSKLRKVTFDSKSTAPPVRPPTPA